MVIGLRLPRHELFQASSPFTFSPVFLSIAGHGLQLVRLGTDSCLYSPSLIWRHRHHLARQLENCCQVSAILGAQASAAIAPWYPCSLNISYLDGHLYPGTWVLSCSSSHESLHQNRARLFGRAACMVEACCFEARFAVHISWSDKRLCSEASPNSGFLQGEQQMIGSVHHSAKVRRFAVFSSKVDVQTSWAGWSCLHALSILNFGHARISLVSLDYLDWCA